MNDIVTLDDIKALVDKFYALVRKDKLLGPIFEKKIGSNWGPHLEIMYRFWGSVLLNGYSYHGNPFSKHSSLPIDKEHFERWLALFNQTLDRHFEGPKAKEASHRATQMAIMFQSKLRYMRDGGMKNIL